MTTTFPIVETDLYPTRYVASEHPGSWAVFETPEGTFRHCRPDAEPRDVKTLWRGANAKGEQAVLSIPQPNERYPHLTDGFYVEVQEWVKYPAHERFVADCYYTAPVEGRAWKGARLHAPTREEAMRLAEQWIADIRAGRIELCDR